MTTLFISDLHLSPENEALIQLTVEFLSSQTDDIDSLYLLGDVFNTWLGDDIVAVEFEPLITQLQQLHQMGIKTYLMVGNRDFMMGKQFAERCGCQLIAEPTIIDLYGIKTLLIHGDSLCIDDVSYQRYRRKTRNKFLQWCFLHLPVRYRQGISDKIKQKSREQKQFKSSMIMDVNQREVSRIMQEHDVQYLIHGHTHRPAIHPFTLANKPTYRIVLGDWENGISVLKCNDHQFVLSDHRISEADSILRIS
jgi:UDP-2,3-diacylglucosamine hydrolase